MLTESSFVKIRTTVPLPSAAEVRKAMHAAGAGVEGKYVGCSSSIISMGRFTPRAGAHPAIGKIGEPQEVEEEIIEMRCHKDLVKKVVGALKAAHPYEEPTIDIIPRFEIE